MFKRFLPILTLTALCWGVLLADTFLWHGQLTQHGIIPRRISGLPGIIWSPFLHGSLHHLAAKTIPLLILGGFLCARSPAEFVMVTVAGIALSGGLTWLIGRDAVHVGASGLVFCYFGYLASLALFTRKIGTLLLSAVCILAYGGILRGILPSSAAISWENHLAGLLAGIALAWMRGKPDAKT